MSSSNSRSSTTWSGAIMSSNATVSMASTETTTGNGLVIMLGLVFGFSVAMLCCWIYVIIVHTRCSALAKPNISNAEHELLDLWDPFTMFESLESDGGPLQYSARCAKCAANLRVGHEWYHLPGDLSYDLCRQHWAELPVTVREAFNHVYTADVLGNERDVYETSALDGVWVNDSNERMCKIDGKVFEWFGDGGTCLIEYTTTGIILPLGTSSLTAIYKNGCLEWDNGLIWYRYSLPVATDEDVEAAWLYQTPALPFRLRRMTSAEGEFF